MTSSRPHAHRARSRSQRCSRRTRRVPSARAPHVELIPGASTPGSAHDEARSHLLLRLERVDRLRPSPEILLVAAVRTPPGPPDPACKAPRPGNSVFRWVLANQSAAERDHRTSALPANRQLTPGVLREVVVKSRQREFPSAAARTIDRPAQHDCIFDGERLVARVRTVVEEHTRLACPLRTFVEALRHLESVRPSKELSTAHREDCDVRVGEIAELEKLPTLQDQLVGVVGPGRELRSASPERTEDRHMIGAREK